ncbi:MAG: pilus assembly protein PilM, partial [Candidatus Omnitrophica bacterium]|nr:pilus assembly protein PilM [Candidatus Omnitrophota bacterium]
AVGGHSRRTVTALIAQPVEGMADEDIARELSGACAAIGFEPGPVLIANPAPFTTPRLFNLPSTDPVEIHDIVELQAEKHTPYTKEEILTDFQVVETDRSGYSRVLLVISHQDIVHRGLRLVERMGWSLERVGFELEGLINWFRLVKGGAAQGGTLVAEMDSDSTTLLILQQGKPYFHRSLAMGVNQLGGDATEGPAKLIAEMQRSLDTFETEGLNVAVSEVVLTGQAERLPGLKDRVQRGLNLPTIVASPFEDCAVSEAAKEATLRQVSFASLLGLALGPSEVDLTPNALKLHRTFEVRARRLVGLGCQVIAGLLLFSCLLIGKALKDERDHAWLLREHQTMAQEAQAVEGVLERLGVIQGWFETRGQLLNAVAELNQHTPHAIQWESVSFTDREQITLKGFSGEMPKVYDFVAELRASPLFSQVEAKRVTKRRVDERDVTEFEIVCSLEPLTS